MKGKSGMRKIFSKYVFCSIKILEQKKFAVFCLARIGCEIIDTEMKFIDKHSTEILFQDKIIL